MQKKRSRYFGIKCVYWIPLCKRFIPSCLATALPSLYLLRLMQKKDPDTSESNVFIGGAYRDRTDDPLRARQVLSQLS